MPLIPLACGWLGCDSSPTFPSRLLGGLVPPPLLALVPVYFWCLVRPDLMTPAAALFAIGIAEDVLSGGPPGVWTLAFVLTYAWWRASATALPACRAWRRCWALPRRPRLCLRLRLFHRGAALAFLTHGAHLPPLAPIVGELAMTVLFYVPTALVVGWLHHRLVGASRGDCLMPLFDKKDKSRYATFTRRSIGMGGA